MRRWALLFPGQGMEAPRMGLALAQHHRGARGLLELTSELVDTDVQRLLRRGGSALSRTEVLQPLLTAVSLGAQLALDTPGLRPDLVAGHSLGELAAWSAAGCVDPAEAVALAALRGRVMAREAERHPGGMLALRGSAADAERAVALGRASGRVDLAAHNGPRAWVLSGERSGLRAVAAAFPGSTSPLQVSGPWHAALLGGAVEEVRAAARRVTTRPPCAGLICNRTGLEAQPARLPDLLAEQLTHPVQWVRTLTTLDGAGITDYIALGPGRVLRGMVRDNLGDRARVHLCDHPDDLDRIKELMSP